MSKELHIFARQKFNVFIIMKEGKIIEAFRLLNGIKMNVVTDKETRSAIISNHLQMYKVAQAHDEEVKKVHEKLFEGKEEDLRKVAELRQSFMNATTDEERARLVKELADNYSHIFALEREFNDVFVAKAEEDVELNVVKFDKAKFIDACADSGVEFTMTDIVRLEEIFKEEE